MHTLKFFSSLYFEMLTKDQKILIKHFVSNFKRILDGLLAYHLVTIHMEIIHLGVTPTCTCLWYPRDRTMYDGAENSKE